MRRLRSLSNFFLQESLQFPKTLQAYNKQTNHIRELDVFIETLARHPKIRTELMAIRSNIIHETFTSDFLLRLNNELDVYEERIYKKNPTFTFEDTLEKGLIHFQECHTQLHSLSGEEKSKTLHKLRIHFKDVRYLFEFFDQMNLLQAESYIEASKAIQNTLGKIQDTKNQIQWLKRLAVKSPELNLQRMITSKKKTLKELKGTIRSAQTL